MNRDSFFRNNRLACPKAIFLTQLRDTPFDTIGDIFGGRLWQMREMIGSAAFVFIHHPHLHEQREDLLEDLTLIERFAVFNEGYTDSAEARLNYLDRLYEALAALDRYNDLTMPKAG